MKSAKKDRRTMQKGLHLLQLREFQTISILKSRLQSYVLSRDKNQADYQGQNSKKSNVCTLQSHYFVSSYSCSCIIESLVFLSRLFSLCTLLLRGPGKRGKKMKKANKENLAEGPKNRFTENR